MVARDCQLYRDSDMTHFDASTSAPDSEIALLDVRQIAALLRCSTRTVYRLAQGGLMPRPRKLGALVRWSKSELERWIAGGCRPVSQHPPRVP